jgi:hypothetical protein
VLINVAVKIGLALPLLGLPSAVFGPPHLHSVYPAMC